jgi:hypothetical protein
VYYTEHRCVKYPSSTERLPECPWTASGLGMISDIPRLAPYANVILGTEFLEKYVKLAVRELD